MWPVLLTLGRQYAPYLVLPIAGVVGTIGYFIEYHLGDRERGRQQDQSTLEKRSQRHLEENVSTDVNELKASIPVSILNRNLNNPENYK